MTEIQFVDKSRVELVKHNANDYDVALAAWVSNKAREDVKIQPPSDYTIRRHEAYLENKNACASESDPKMIQQYEKKMRFHEDHYKKVEDYIKSLSGLINFLYRERHMSPFEHGSFTFYIDTPIFVAREFMRHRTWSYNETSGRYRELNSRFYLIPPDRPLVQSGKVGAYRFAPGSPEQYGEVFANTTYANGAAWTAYQNMLDTGVAREVARNVLPVNTMTQFYATANPRNVMQFLLLRNDENALFEIREVAKAIEEKFAKKMPYTYEAFRKYDPRDERSELIELRKRVAQMEAYETYRTNLEVG